MRRKLFQIVFLLVLANVFASHDIEVCTGADDQTNVDGKGKKILQATTSGRPMVIEDLFRIRRVADLSISPDGSLVAYQITDVNVEKNESKTAIYVAKSDGSEKPWLLPTRARRICIRDLVPMASRFCFSPIDQDRCSFG